MTLPFPTQMDTISTEIVIASPAHPFSIPVMGGVDICDRQGGVRDELSLEKPVDLVRESECFQAVAHIIVGRGITEV